MAAILTEMVLWQPAFFQCIDGFRHPHEQERAAALNRDRAIAAIDSASSLSSPLREHPDPVGDYLARILRRDARPSDLDQGARIHTSLT